LFARTGYSRNAVCNILRDQRTEVFRARWNSLEAHLSWLDEQWASRLRNSPVLKRQLKRRGLPANLRVVGKYASRRRQSEKV